MPLTAHFHRLKAGSSSQRKSILRNLVSSLIQHESITTTLAKAKAVQPYAEKVITLGKKYTGRKDQRERLTNYLYDFKVTLPKLFDELATRYANRPGGYTRIHKLPPRYGDMAPLAILELVDGKRDMLLCMTARNIARSAILGTKWVSKATRDAMFRLFQFGGETAIQKFEKEVARQQEILERQDKLYNQDLERRNNISFERLEERLYVRDKQNTSVWDRKARRWLVERGKEREKQDLFVPKELADKYFEGRFRGTQTQMSQYLKDEIEFEKVKDPETVEKLRERSRGMKAKKKSTSTKSFKN